MDRADQARRGDQLLDLDPDRVAVVLVDFQRDFCDPPGLDPRQAGTTGNARTAQRANTFAAQAADLGVRTIYTQQVLDLDRLTTRQRRWEQATQLCVAGTAGADLYLPPVPGAQVVRKYRFDIWQSHQFLDLLTRWNIDGLVIGGVELQCCVLYAVLGAEERGFHYVVPQDLVSGLDRCETTTNQAIRDYLRHAHPSPATADTLLAGWHHRRDATR